MHMFKHSLVLRGTGASHIYTSRKRSKSVRVLPAGCKYSSSQLALYASSKSAHIIWIASGSG
jgi:hypothetical protein